VLRLHILHQAPDPDYILGRPGTPPTVKGVYGPRWEHTADWIRHRAAIDTLLTAARTTYADRQEASPQHMQQFDDLWRDWYRLAGRELTRNFGVTYTVGTQAVLKLATPPRTCADLPTWATTRQPLAVDRAPANGGYRGAPHRHSALDYRLDWLAYRYLGQTRYDAPPRPLSERRLLVLAGGSSQDASSRLRSPGLARRCPGEG
jgi:hypothetical protein